MGVSTSDDEARFHTADRSWPHARISGPMRGVGDQAVLDERDGLGANSAPAGGVSTSPADIARWIQIQLAHGQLPEGAGRLFSEAASKEMWTPQTLIPITPPPAAAAA